MVGAIIGNAISNMNQGSQPAQPTNTASDPAEVISPNATGSSDMGSDADPYVVPLPPGSQLAQAAATANAAGAFQNSIQVAPGVPNNVGDLKNQLHPEAQCWSLPQAALALTTPPKNGVSYGSAQELIDAAKDAKQQGKIKSIQEVAAPPANLGPNQVMIVADQDPKTGQYGTGHCGVGDSNGGVNDFTKPAPSALTPIPAKISHSTSPTEFMNQSVTRTRGDGSTFTVQPFAGKKIIIITK